MKQRLPTLLVSLVATGLFLGIAVLGRGGFVAFFSQPALTAVAVITLGLTVLAAFTEGNLSSGQQEDRANRWVLVALVLIALAGAYVPAYTDRTGFWTFGGNGVRWFGVTLFAIGGIVRIWPVFVLGRQFSGLVAIQPGHQLVTTGIYSVIRNPSYLGLLIAAVGWGVAFRSAIGVLLALLNIPLLIVRMRSEEKLLRSHFGAAYDAYCARTSRLIPGVY